MNKLNLNKWSDFKKSLHQNENIGKKEILYSLNNIRIEISNNKSGNILNTYNTYLKYYENIENLNLVFDNNENWYSIIDIVKYDILRPEINSVEELIVKVSEIMWNLLVFKSDIECDNCKDDFFRVLTNKNEDKLYLSCDLCGNLKGYKGKIDKNPDEKLLPVKPYQINREKIKSTSYF